MSEPALNIAAAVVRVRTATQHEMAARIAVLDHAEVAIVEQGRIVVVIEAEQRDDLGRTLDCIAALDGVLSATLVFEHSDPVGDAT